VGWSQQPTSRPWSQSHSCYILCLDKNLPRNFQESLLLQLVQHPWIGSSAGESRQDKPIPWPSTLWNVLSALVHIHMCGVCEKQRECNLPQVKQASNAKTKKTAAIPDGLLSMATVMASQINTTHIPIAIMMNRRRLPTESIIYHCKQSDNPSVAILVKVNIPSGKKR